MQRPLLRTAGSVCMMQLNPESVLLVCLTRAIPYLIYTSNSTWCSSRVGAVGKRTGVGWLWMRHMTLEPHNQPPPVRLLTGPMLKTTCTSTRPLCFKTGIQASSRRKLPLFPTDCLVCCNRCCLGAFVFCLCLLQLAVTAAGCCCCCHRCRLLLLLPLLPTAAAAAAAGMTL